jgi:hypothetical protein
VIPRLSPGEVHQHTVTFVCFAAGAYKLSCQCRRELLHNLTREDDDGRGGGRGGDGGNGENDSGSGGDGSGDVGGVVAGRPWRFGDDPSSFQPEMGSAGMASVEVSFVLAPFFFLPPCLYFRK